MSGVKRCLLYIAIECNKRRELTVLQIAFQLGNSILGTRKGFWYALAIARIKRLPLVHNDPHVNHTFSLCPYVSQLFSNCGTCGGPLTPSCLPCALLMKHTLFPHFSRMFAIRRAAAEK